VRECHDGTGPSCLYVDADEQFSSLFRGNHPVTVGVDTGVKVNTDVTQVSPGMLIGELAERTGASTRSLRYYEEQGLLTSRRAGNGYRIYAADSVSTVSVIRHLLDAGLGTATIRDLLPCVRGGSPSIDHCPRTMAVLREALAEMEDSMSELNRKHSEVSRLLPSRD
jgi:DNA-binding transcriptional MerR regulator